MKLLHAPLKIGADGKGKSKSQGYKESHTHTHIHTNFYSTLTTCLSLSQTQTVLLGWCRSKTTHLLISVNVDIQISWELDYRI